MSGKEKYDISSYIKDTEKKVNEFVLEKDQLNNKLKNYILSLQNMDFEIYSILFDARAFYYEKRYNYNKKLAKLKNQKVEYERSWNHLTKKIRTLQEPKINSNISISFDYIKRSVDVIENKINIMKKRLEEQILNIEEENEIIEQLRELESDKQEKITKLVNIKQKQIEELQNSDYYKTQKRIETLEKNLKEIYEQMIKLFDKRLITHKKMFDLFRKINNYENIKKKMNNELIQNKNIFNDYHQLFLKLMNQNKKKLVEDLLKRPKIKLRPRNVRTPNIKAIIKKKKKYKKLEQKKLEIALDKKKSGKKLDFYELQLILKHSKNKRL